MSSAISQDGRTRVGQNSQADSDPEAHRVKVQTYPSPAGPVPTCVMRSSVSLALDMFPTQ
jgi:hypothetical protein